MLHIHVLAVAPLGTGHMAEPGADQHEGRIAIRETAHHPGAAADFPVEPFNHIVCADTSPVFAGKVAVSQGLLNTVLNFLGGLFQFHGTKFLHNCFGLLTGSLLALLGMNRFEHLGHQLHLGARHSREHIAVKVDGTALVFGIGVFTYQSKVARCAETVADLYFKTYQAGSTQLVFCDTSTPKAGFNLYDELKDRLIRFGVSEDQIAFIHSAGTEAGRSALFAAVRAGQIRILIGSTFKLGLGVNVQDKLIALHHLDVPWRPADMVQREGRILRQGNENGKIHIFRYITEGSFDAYSWQLLEAKQRMIAGILSGSLAERSGPDIEGTALNYAEVKALAVGDPLIKERVAAANELARYTVLQRRRGEAKLRMEQELMELPAKMRAQREAVLKCEGDLARVLSWKASRPAQDGGQGRREQAAERKAIRERIRQGLEDNVLKTKETPLMKYRGFDVILPANMTLQKPYAWLSGQGRYYVELGSTEVGNLARIDHFLNNLGEYLRTLKLGCSKLEKREAELKVELAKGETYTEEIERYRKKVELLDKELGVN